jgi:hypothetical protein
MSPVSDLQAVDMVGAWVVRNHVEGFAAHRTTCDGLAFLFGVKRDSTLRIKVVVHFDADRQNPVTLTMSARSMYDPSNRMPLTFDGVRQGTWKHLEPSEFFNGSPDGGHDDSTKYAITVASVKVRTAPQK